MFTLRIGMKTMKVFIEKVKTAHHWFLPVFALEHLQQCSVYDLLLRYVFCIKLFFTFYQQKGKQK